MSSNPADFVNLGGGGLDAAPTPPTGIHPTVSNTPVVPAAPSVPAPQQATPPVVDGLSVEDDGGGPTGHFTTPAVHITPQAVGAAGAADEVALQDNPPQGAMQGVPVQVAVEDMLSAMAGKTVTPKTTTSSASGRPRRASATAPQPLAQVVPIAAPLPVAPVAVVQATPPAFNPPPPVFVSPAIVAPVVTQAQAVPPTSQPVEPRPSIASPIATPAPAEPVQAQVPGIPQVPFTPAAQPVNPVAESQALWAIIEGHIKKLQWDTGAVALDNPKAIDLNNVIHVAIYNMRYNPMALVNMTAKDLCVYEAALAAHQVWVQTQETWWSARHLFLGPELSRILRNRRSKYKGDTEKAKEDAVCEHEPEVEALRREFVTAQAISTYLHDFGAKFSQLEDGLKRTINQRQKEEDRTGVQQRWVP